MEPAAAGLWCGGGGKKGSGLMCRIVFVSSDNYGRGKVAVSKKKINRLLKMKRILL